MNDETKVRNLQAAYNYYVDRKMWDDVADLFAADGVLEIGGIGVYDGPRGARRAMERMGPAGLTHGQLNDHLLFDDVAQILSGGREARMRGFELAMVGEADKGTQHWEVNVFANRFVKESGIWKVREMRIFPLLRSEYREGWGKSRLSEPAPTGALAPDHPAPTSDEGNQDTIIPAFHAPNPVTGRTVALPSGKKFVAATPLTAQIPSAAPGSGSGSDDAPLVEASRGLSMAMAYDGAENVNSAYGHVIDDFQWTAMSKLFGKHGAKEVPFAGYYAGFDRISHSVFLEYGDAVTTGRAGIAFHWLIQPVINIAADGRSATPRTATCSIRTPRRCPAARVSSVPCIRPISLYWRTVSGGCGICRWMSPTSVWWVAGKAAGRARRRHTRPHPPRPPAIPSGPTHYFGAALVAKFAPDVPITVLGAREEHFRRGHR